MFAGCVTETPPAAAVIGIETVDEDLFEPDADPEPDEPAREAEADCEDDMIGCDRLSVDDRTKDVDVFLIIYKGASGLLLRSRRDDGFVEIVRTRKEYREARKWK